jgi:hypothetical protein
VLLLLLLLLLVHSIKSHQIATQPAQLFLIIPQDTSRQYRSGIPAAVHAAAAATATGNTL